MRLGDFVGAYQVIDQAPIDFIRGSRTRNLNGRCVTGSWSDPWWLYSPICGWRLARRWKSKAVEANRLSAAVPAMDEYAIEEVETS